MMTPSEAYTELQQARARIVFLQRQVEQARQTAAVERARADAATASQHRAWSLGSWTPSKSPSNRT